MRLIKKDAPQQALGLMAAAGSFAAVSTIFGSPVIGAVLIIEATGLGGAVLPLVLLPGLLAAGVGSLVFIGLGSWSGFSTSAWQLSPFALPPFERPRLGRLRLDDRARRRGGSDRVRDHGARPVEQAAGRHPAVRADRRRRSRGRRARDRVRRGDRQVGERGALLGPGGLRLALQLRVDALGLDAGAALPVQGRSPGASRWEASAAAPPSRRSSSASSPG